VKRPPASKVATEQHSAGGLVVRGDEVLLIATAGGRRWQLPKGHLEAGELPAQAAVREVREETGVTGTIVEPLSGVDYTFFERGVHRITKHVDYFLLAYESGSETNFEPREVVTARWFPWTEAIARLSHANDRKVAEQAWRIVRERQQETSPQGVEK
jgi:8-oxo-dGTP pyrophosphatase MutT (NUDIX family)